ncbi:aminopeptidase [Bordetella pertussis]|nr:aminopeptidase [Bordetella pertussis]
MANRTWLEGELGEFLCFETLTLCPIDTRAPRCNGCRRAPGRWARTERPPDAGPAGGKSGTGLACGRAPT